MAGKKNEEQATAPETIDEKGGASPAADGEFEDLISWNLVEEKVPYSRDREILLGFVGFSALIITAVVGYYVFSVFLAIATAVFVYQGRQKPRNLSFTITNHGVNLNDKDFVFLENIDSYNIIDDPGQRARLIIRVKKYTLYLNDILPIYDVDMESIDSAFASIGVEKDPELEPNLLDKFAVFL